MRISVAVFMLAPLLAACGGGRGSSEAPTIPQPPLAAPLSSGAALSEAQSDARRAPEPLFTPGTNDLLYVGNQGNNSITIYKHDASGNTAPIKVIAGSKTGLASPGQLSEDAQGNLYVANGTNSDAGSILVFAHDANGNVSPVRKLYGPKTKLQGIGSMTVDQATGKLFVGTIYYPGGGYPDPIIMRFPPNATGNEAPFATYDFGCATNQLASDSSGKNLLVAWSDCIADSFSGVAWVGKQFPTAISPPYGIDSFQPQGIADDPTTKTYLVTHQSDVLPGIVRFAEDTTGYGPDSPAYPKYSFQPKVVSDITSAADCGELALGYLRNIYAVCGNNTIKVFTHDSSGNVPPLRTLKGSATKLNQPYGIYEGQ